MDPWRPPIVAQSEEPRQSRLLGLLSLLSWPRRPPRGALKQSVLSALADIKHYEDPLDWRVVDPQAPNARSVGWSYREIKARVEAEYPGCRVSMMSIRAYARDAKEQGMTMPARRPYSRRLGRGRP